MKFLMTMGNGVHFFKTWTKSTFFPIFFFSKKDDDEGGSGVGGLEESVGKDGESGVLTEGERQLLRQEYWEKYEIDLLRFGQ